MAQEIYIFHPGVGQNRPADGASIAQKIGVNFAYLQQEYPKLDKVSFFHGAVVPPGLASSGNVTLRLVFRQVGAGAGNVYVNANYRLLDHNPPITYPDRDGAALSLFAAKMAVPLPGTIGQETKVEFTRSVASFPSGREILLSIGREGTHLLDTFNGVVALDRVDLEFPLADLTYTNLTAVPQPLGGVMPGDTFLNQTMQQMWDTLLYPFAFPAFTLFEIAAHPTGLLEVGDAIATPATFNWTRTNAGNIVPNSIFIFDLTSAPPPPPQTLGANLPDTLSAVLALFGGIPLVYLVPATHQFLIRGQNSRVPTYPPPSGYFTRTMSVDWAFRRFYGNYNPAAPDPISEAEIEALASNPLLPGFAGNYSFPISIAPGTYKYICYASTLGTATTFTDTLTGLNVAMNAPYLVSVTNTFGVTVNYNVHRTTFKITDAITIAVA